MPRGGRCARLRQVKCKRASFPHGAGDAKLPAEQASNVPADRQPQASAPEFAAGACVGLLERLENNPQLVGGDADARVDHGEGDDGCRATEHRMVGAPALGGRHNLQIHLAVLGELEGVGEQVPENLLQAPRIRMDGRRQIARELNVEAEPLILCNRMESPLHILL